MKRTLKNVTELFEYLIRGYVYELEDVKTQNGIQKRLKDNELEQELKIKTKEYIIVKDLSVELKLGPNYNRTEKPWIQIFSKANRSGTKGRYVGISISKELDDTIEIWIGFGRTKKKQSEVFELARQYKIKYAIIEPNLKYEFSYNTENYESVIIKKEINMKNFDEEEFARDLEYITNLYKSYEVRFENAMIPTKEIEKLDIVSKEVITYEEINKRMLSLIEQVGNLAEAIRNLS